MHPLLIIQEQIEEAKKDWELSRLKQIKEEEERRAEMEEDEILFTYTSEDAQNKVLKNKQAKSKKNRASSRVIKPPGSSAEKRASRSVEARTSTRSTRSNASSPVLRSRNASPEGPRVTSPLRSGPGSPTRTKVASPERSVTLRSDKSRLRSSDEPLSPPLASLPPPPVTTTAVSSTSRNRSRRVSSTSAASETTTVEKVSSTSAASETATAKSPPYNAIPTHGWTTRSKRKSVDIEFVDIREVEKRAKAAAAEKAAAAAAAQSASLQQQRTSEKKTEENSKSENKTDVVNDVSKDKAPLVQVKSPPHGNHEDSAENILANIQKLTATIENALQNEPEQKSEIQQANQMDITTVTSTSKVKTLNPVAVKDSKSVILNVPKVSPSSSVLVTTSPLQQLATVVQSVSTKMPSKEIPMDLCVNQSNGQHFNTNSTKTTQELPLDFKSEPSTSVAGKVERPRTPIFEKIQSESPTSSPKHPSSPKLPPTEEPNVFERMKLAVPKIGSQLASDKQLQKAPRERVGLFEKMKAAFALRKSMQSAAKKVPVSEAATEVVDTTASAKPVVTKSDSVESEKAASPSQSQVQPESKPEESEDVDVVMVDEQETMPPNDRVKEENKEVLPSESIKVQTESPVSDIIDVVNTEPVQPNPVTTKSENPVSVSEKSEKTATVTAESEEPIPVTVESEKPVPATTKSEEPAPVTAESEKTDPATTKSEEPVPATAESEKPVPVTTMLEEPVPATAESEKPVPVNTMSEEAVPATTESEKTVPITTKSVELVPETAESEKTVPITTRSEEPVVTTESEEPAGKEEEEFRPDDTSGDRTHINDDAKDSDPQKKLDVSTALPSEEAMDQAPSSPMVIQKQVTASEDDDMTLESKDTEKPEEQIANTVKQQDKDSEMPMEEPGTDASHKESVTTEIKPTSIAVIEPQQLTSISVNVEPPSTPEAKSAVARLHIIKSLSPDASNPIISTKSKSPSPDRPRSPVFDVPKAATLLSGSPTPDNPFSRGNSDESPKFPSPPSSTEKPKVIKNSVGQIQQMEGGANTDQKEVLHEGKQVESGDNDITESSKHEEVQQPVEEKSGDTQDVNKEVSVENKPSEKETPVSTEPAQDEGKEVSNPHPSETDSQVTTEPETVKPSEPSIDANTPLYLDIDEMAAPSLVKQSPRTERLSLEGEPEMPKISPIFKVMPPGKPREDAPALPMEIGNTPVSSQKEKPSNKSKSREMTKTPESSRLFQEKLQAKSSEDSEEKLQKVDGNAKEPTDNGDQDQVSDKKGEKEKVTRSEKAPTNVNKMNANHVDNNKKDESETSSDDESSEDDGLPRTTRAKAALLAAQERRQLRSEGRGALLKPLPYKPTLHKGKVLSRRPHQRRLSGSQSTTSQSDSSPSSRKRPRPLERNKSSPTNSDSSPQQSPTSPKGRGRPRKYSRTEEKSSTDKETSKSLRKSRSSNKDDSDSDSSPVRNPRSRLRNASSSDLASSGTDSKRESRTRSKSVASNSPSIAELELGARTRSRHNSSATSRTSSRSSSAANSRDASPARTNDGNTVNKQRRLSERRRSIRS